MYKYEKKKNYSDNLGYKLILSIAYLGVWFSHAGLYSRGTVMVR